MIQNVFNRRVVITGILILCVACVYIARLASLHFSRSITIPEPPDAHEYVRRGFIKDAGGGILAASVEARSLYVNPQELESPEDAAVKLAPILGVSEQYVLQRAARHSKRFVWLKRKLPDATADRIAALDIKGLHFKKEYIRVYPYGSLGANLIGFTNADNYGMEGVEYKFDEMLVSHSDPVFEGSRGDFRCGNSVVLTIDRFIQYTAEKAVQEAVTQNNARQGVIIISEVRSGKILALAKYPSYDPNNYRFYTADQRNNFTVSEPFEPGSTMKIFSVAAWMMSHPKNVRQQWRCEGGIDLMDEHINCTGVHGMVDINDSIKYSCNVGIISSMKEINAGYLHTVLRSFGFGERTTRDIAGESPGVLREPKDWSGLSKYSVSIGQELSVTSLQLASAYGAIANDGIYYPPVLVQSIEDGRGNVIERTPIRPKGRIMPADVARSLRGMLSLVVESGTGKSAAPIYYHAAGKTGTAQKSRGGQYVKDLNIGSFAGIAPYENPDICMIVIIDEPKGVTSGGVVAAPFFAKLADRILPYRGVTLHPLKNSQPASAPEIVYNGTTVPDFTGRPLHEAVKILVAVQGKYPITYSIEGTGRVYSQIPAPGTPVMNAPNIVLYLRGGDDGTVQE